MINYSVPKYYDAVEEIKIRFVKNKKVYNFLVKNEDHIFDILKEIHTGEIIDKEKSFYIILGENNIEIEKEIYEYLKEYKSSYVEVLINSLKLGMRNSDLRLVINTFKEEKERLEKEKNSDPKFYYSLESKSFSEDINKISYDDPYELIDGIRKDYFNPFISLFFLPIEKKSLNFSFNPNFLDKEDSYLIKWIEDLIEALKEKILEIESEDFDFDLENFKLNENVKKHLLKNKIKYFYMLQGYEEEKIAENFEKKYQDIEKNFSGYSVGVCLQLPNALRDVYKELKNKIKKNPNELIEFFKVDCNLKNSQEIKKIEFDYLENLKALGYKVEFMKAYCKHNGIKILIEGVEKKEDRNYISNGIKKFNYIFLQNKNGVLLRKSSKAHVEYKEHHLKFILEEENLKIKKNKKEEIKIKEVLRRLNTFGSYSELQECLEKIRENYIAIENTFIEISIIGGNDKEENIEYLKETTEKFKKINGEEEIKLIKKEKWEDSFDYSVDEYKKSKKNLLPLLRKIVGVEASDCIDFSDNEWEKLSRNLSGIYSQSVRFKTGDVIMFFKDIIESLEEYNSSILKEDSKFNIKEMYKIYDRNTGKSKGEEKIERMLFYKLVNAFSSSAYKTSPNLLTEFKYKKVEILDLYFYIESLYLNQKREEKFTVKIFDENIIKNEDMIENMYLNN